MSDFETAKQFFFEGLQLLEANNLQGAEIRFARCLEIVPERVSALNNLSAVKIKLSKFAEAEELALKAVALEDKSPEAWSNLGLALTSTGRQEEALRACDRALECNASYAMGWLAKAVTLRELTRYDEALLACDRALKLDPDKYEILYQKSLILKELARPEEAQDLYRKALDMRVALAPVFIGERRATQKAEGLIINRNPDMDPSFRSFEDLSRFCSNFPGQLGNVLCEDFHFNYAFVAEAVRPAVRKEIPQPDFVINNYVNAELLASEGRLAGLKELVESFGVPVVNHPAKAIPTARDLSARLLDGIPGVRVPRTMRFSAVGKTCEDLAQEIEKHYDYPLITRTLVSQEGKGMNKVESRDALVEVLSAADRPERFFVTQFVDSRGKNEFHRKIRAAIVKDEIIVVRSDYHTGWNVHARKSEKCVPFYLTHTYLLEEEKRICHDPEAALGRPAMQSLRAIRDRISLDVFGIDFDIDADGLVVFYEANATMNLFSTARKEVPNPREAADRLKLAFQRYFTSLVNRVTTSPARKA
jgi:tetratricopeptide (TPR) repeat protein/glutathione synthase/RimK-type ligase-like ATP-grasp enzyme